MAENAKTGVAESADAKKGRASEKNEVKEAEVVAQDDANVTEEAVTQADTEVEEKADKDDTVTPKSARKTRKSSRVAKESKVKAAAREALEAVATATAQDEAQEADPHEEFQAEIREQIENCQNELRVALERSIKHEYVAIVEKQVKAVNRRRRVGVAVRDLMILILAATVGYFGWCLYDAKYFDWMGPREAAPVEEQKPEEPDKPEEVVKDTRWYVNNYGYLFEDLQLGLSADEIEAYYLYSDDRKVSEMKPAYLLGMAYNKVMPTNSSTAVAEAETAVAAADLRTAFEGMFGTLDYFEKVSFAHGCKKFSYMRETDSFVTDNGNCEVKGEREVVEEIDEMYEEGSVLYVLTTAAIYDEKEASFYTFDNLFKPVVTEATKEDLAKNRAVLNRYQYQFKKTGEKYHFSGVVKLR